MAKKLSNTQKIHKIQKLLDEKLKTAGAFDMVYIVKDIAAIVFDITEEDFERAEESHRRMTYKEVREAIKK